MNPVRGANGRGGIPALLLLSILPLLSCSGRERPSVLLVTIDTLRSDRLGCYGSAGVKTPCLDRIAREGVLFADCTTPIPETSPAHVSILSGLYPQHHGTRQNGVAIDGGVKLLPDLFRKDGYATAGFVSGFPLVSKFGFGRGFDHFDDYLTDGFTTQGGNVQGTERSAEKTADAFLFWLRKADRPFFAWVHLFDPHAVYAAPPPYRRMYYSGNEREKANRSMDGIELPGYLMLSGVTDIRYPVGLYDGEVSYTDAQLGRIVDGLAEEGLLDDVVLVVAADHGESLTEHGYYFGHSQFLYRQSVHVPLLLRWPGRLPARTIVEGGASLLDLAGTICELAGLDAPLRGDGRSLLPAIHASRPAERPRFLERSLLAGPGMAGVRLGDWKYVRSNERGEELYDVAGDPAEMWNAAAARPEKTDELRALLDGWRRLGAEPSPAMDEETREILRGLGYVN